MIIPSSSTNASDDNPINNSYNFQNNELNKSESEAEDIISEIVKFYCGFVDTLNNLAKC